ncbi:unnamed protein product [Brassicogethes aeneus]|uniref:DUF4817 domain-containing protein n=1 Tax=Brassicogethes aeneus TaxID=1431903 RepID=A0A9P0B2M2_BRAAE|nr:unnamed protein product [Brassicogethes aeneus]
MTLFLPCRSFVHTNRYIPTRHDKPREITPVYGQLLAGHTQALFRAVYRGVLGCSGVPQGSNLGSLMFLIFINDLPSNLNVPSLLFADDLKVFFQISSIQDCINLQTKRPPSVKQLFIMDFLTVEEKIEMILIYGEAGRNLDDAVNIYAQRFPDKIRSSTSFHRTVKRFTTNGSVQPRNSFRLATVTGGNNEINVLAATAANPHACT